MARGTATEDDRRLQNKYRLDWWVDPELAWEVRDDRSDTGEKWKQVDIAGPAKEQLIVALRELHSSSLDKHGTIPSLLILNGAGAGKSCCSLRIEHLLANPLSSKQIFGTDRPLLVVHWASKLPDSVYPAIPLPQALAADPEVRRYLELLHNKSWVAELLEESILYALRSNRVAIIVDGFDEFAQTSKEILKHLFFQSIYPKPLWIFTSRDYAVRDNEELFADSFFRRVRIKPFSGTLQNQFMDLALKTDMLGRDRWRDTLDPSQVGWDELLGLPHTLRALADLLNLEPEVFGPDGKVKQDIRFQSPSDLFLRTSRHLLKTELEKDNVKQLKIQHQITDSSLDLIPELERAMGAIALEMATRGYWTQVQGSLESVRVEVNKVRESARRRFLSSRKGDFSSEKESEKLWEFTYAVLKSFEFSGGGLQLDAGASFLQFPSRKVQEMRIARYLTRYMADEDGECIYLDDADKRYASAVAPQQLSEARRGAIKHHSSDAWEEVWRNTINMPLSSKKRPGLEVSRYKTVLHWLFQPAYAGEDRPTELMTEAWVQAQKLARQERGLTTLADELVSGLQSQFQQILDDSTDTDRQAIAKSLIDPATYQILGKDSGSNLPFDNGEFLMGEKKYDKDDNLTSDKVPVSLSRFGMQKLLISNAQFRLFSNEEYIIGSIYGLPNRPATLVSWFDAFWFSRFIGEVKVNGGRYHVTLPTEAQWEYSARAGCDGDYFHAWVDDCDKTKGYFEVWRVSLHKYAHFEQEMTHRFTVPVDSKLPNLWGLRMAGICYQWMLDAAQYILPSGEDPLVTGGLGTDRVLRGASWRDRAVAFRSAARDRADPSFRGFNCHGFRVALSPSGIPKSAEQQSGIKIE
jgi:formylglycine-generating enzyme required for sulfatase activity